MVFLRLDDLSGSVETVVFNSVYASARDLLEADRVLVVKGRVDHKQEGETKLIAMEVAPFEATPERSEVRLKVDARKAPAGLIRELADLVREYPGEAPVVVALETSEGRGRYAFGPDFTRPPRAGLLRRGEVAPRRSGCHLAPGGSGSDTLSRRSACLGRESPKYADRRG